MYNTTADVDALVDAPQKIRARSTSPPRSMSSQSRRPAGVTPATAGAVAADDGIKYPAAAARRPPPPRMTSPRSSKCSATATARNEFVLELGAGAALFDLLKKVTERVPGCMSEVYVLGRRPGSDDTLEFLADANADIVRGLIAILTKLFAGQRAADVLAFDVQKFFGRIGLDQFISSQRRNGLEDGRRIRAMATELAPEMRPPAWNRRTATTSTAR